MNLNKDHQKVCMSGLCQAPLHAAFTAFSLDHWTALTRYLDVVGLAIGNNASLNARR